jgi:PHD/YefM family antitoxin component YafN of YafNO toxin-antitoxin module
MEILTASEAKQNFGRALALAAQAPVAIEKHGRLVAAIVPPSWFEQERASRKDARLRARLEQAQIEQRRLMVHQQIGIELLSDAARRRALLKAARTEVRRWSDLGLCTADYIERWTAWLNLPVGQLVARMCSTTDAWAPAMRQNSPFTAVV